MAAISPNTQHHPTPPDPQAVIPPTDAAAIERAPGRCDEVLIDIAPNRPRGQIRVELVPAGRSAPIPADDPWAG
jgi:hypothetical protein